LLNEDEFPGNIKMEIIEFHQTLGAFLDREENKLRSVNYY
jgi:hypothetical protein